MFKSFISPEKIIGNGTKAASPEAFSNFMLGRETSLGEKVLKSATNNISNFSRKGVSVDTSSNISSLLETISTNITNNVDNSINNTLNSFKTEIQTSLSDIQKQVQSNLLNSFKTEIQTSLSDIQKQVQSTLSTVIQNFSKDYQQRIQSKEDNKPSNISKDYQQRIQSKEDNKPSNVLKNYQQQVQSTLSTVIQNFSKDYQQRIQSKEDNKPSNVLKGFLGLYQNAIDFVSFFGDSKNNKKIETSLKSLRSMFDESFNTAIVIRQVINKIVKQLSNLPTASGNAGPLNLDVSVPGGRLKQAGGASIGKFLKGGGGKILGAGVVGAGALGMMNMQAARASQEEKLAETAKKGVGGEDKPNEFMEGLNSIIERFSDAIDGLLGRKKTPPGGGGGSASSGGGSTNGGGGTTGAGGGGSPTLVTGSEQEKVEKVLGSYEGSKLKAYQDTNGIWTIGEGNTRINGRAVRPGDTITAEQSIQMKRSAIEEHRQRAINQVGLQKWSSLPENTRVALTSLVYNYGSIPPKVLPSVRLGDSEKIASAIEGLSGDDSGVNAWRRKDEAMIIRTGKSSRVNIYPSNTTRVSQQISPTVSPTVSPQPAKKPPAATPAPRPSPKVEPAQNPKAREVSQAITSPGQNAKNNVEVASLPPNITVIPGGESQNRGGVVPLSPPSGDAPDVSMYGSTGNPNNPNPYTSLILGMNFA